MKIRMELNPGGKIPKGYGMAYPVLSKYTYVIYPIPINWIMRFARAIHLILLKCFTTKIEKMVFRARSDGYREGFERGYKQFERALEDIARKLGGL